MTSLLDLYPTMLGRAPRGNPHSTSGAQAMMLALSSCDRVDAYGLFQTAFTRGSSYHYYGEFMQQHSTEHFSFGAEYDLWLKLSDTPLEDIFSKGFASFRGFPSMTNCDDSAAWHAPPKIHRPTSARGNSYKIRSQPGSAVRKKRCFRSFKLEKRATGKSRKRRCQPGAAAAQSGCRRAAEDESADVGSSMGDSAAHG